MYVGKEWRWAKPIARKTEMENVKVLNGYVFYNQEWEPWHPFRYSNLPNQLAKIESTEKIVSFVEKYGVLGYQALIKDNPGTDTYTLGDPIDWFLQQAKTVKFALQLINAIQEETEEENLKKLIYSTQIQVPLKMFLKNTPEKLTANAHCFAQGPEITFITIEQPKKWEGIHRSLAIQMVSHLVNSNTKGVNRTIGLKEEGFTPVEPYQFAHTINSRSLIEAIWYQVGDTALNSQGKGTRICKECGLPFVVTDKRQQFCPDDYSGSLCGLRYRVRNSRKNKKKGE